MDQTSLMSHNIIDYSLQMLHIKSLLIINIYVSCSNTTTRGNLSIIQQYSKTNWSQT